LGYSLSKTKEDKRNQDKRREDKTRQDKRRQGKASKRREDKEHKKWQGLRAFYALFIRGEGRGREEGDKG
jgi:hypothetical protein